MQFFVPTINRWVRKQGIVSLLEGRSSSPWFPAWLLVRPTIFLGHTSHLLPVTQYWSHNERWKHLWEKIKTIEIGILRNQIKVTLLQYHFTKTAPKISKIQILNSSSPLQKTCEHSAPAASSHFDPDLLPLFLHLLPLFPPAIVGQPLFAG